MTTVDILLDRVSRAPGGAVEVSDGAYHLEAAAGRPDSVCFTLEEVARGVRINLAEGFSLNGQIVYDQRRLPEPVIEHIIRGLVGEIPATIAPGMAPLENVA